MMMEQKRKKKRQQQSTKLWLVLWQEVAAGEHCELKLRFDGEGPFSVELSLLSLWLFGSFVACCPWGINLYMRK